MSGFCNNGEGIEDTVFYGLVLTFILDLYHHHILILSVCLSLFCFLSKYLSLNVHIF